VLPLDQAALAGLELVYRADFDDLGQRGCKS
jgi:hypothetical protein